jgi:DNA mismatch repair protein MLH3
MTPKLRVLDLLQSDAVSSRFLRQRFSADDLKEAQVISQVDRKFVACLVRDDQDMSLVLVDQHAADERIRVERILKQLCDEWSAGKVSRRDLDPPKRVVLTDRENYLMQSSNGTGRRYLTSWGIDVKDVDPDASRSQSGLCQAEVTAVPEIIADKVSALIRLPGVVLTSFPL